MIKIRQTLDVHARREAVWDFLLDADRVAACMPGVESIQLLREDAYSVTVSLRIGPIKPRFHGEVAFVDKNPPESMSISLDWKDELTSSKARSLMKVRLIDALPESTTVIVEGDVDVLGALGKYGQGVADRKAGEIANTFAENMQAALLT